MRAATDLLTQYAAYHRDERNILSHFIGVPLMVLSIAVLLAKPVVALGGLSLTPAWIVFALVAVWYLTRGSLVLGMAVSTFVGLLVLFGQHAASGSTAAWLSWGFGCFAVGWLIQFAGHLYEGKKPAFIDDLSSLLVGPMFVVAEVLFALGWNKPLHAHIEQRVGPTMLRDLAKIA